MVSTTATEQENAAHESDPTVTIVDSDTDNMNLVDNNRRRRRSCCFCIPERVGVIAILSLYFLFGVLNTAASFTGLTFAQSTRDQAFLIISGILSIFLAVTGIFGVSAVRKENAIMMRRISIAFLVQTLIQLVFNAIDFAFDVASKPSLVQDCQDALRSGEYTTDDLNGMDCEHVVNFLLVREAFKVVLSETLMLYFGYVIYCYSRRMPIQNTDSARNSTQQPPTYFVYATRPPTDTNWVPPPTYSGNPNNIPLAEDTKETYQPV